jgi:ATP-dependent exoDNAse (exonuclease V) alpha subunit
MRDQGGLDATTIARLRWALEHGVSLSPGTVLIVDEAGMVGTRDLAALACAARHAKAKLVLVGDDRQLPEIDAGGAFRALADRLGAIELLQVRRQRESWDRDALAALRDGDVERFAREYHRHGRLVATASAGTARAALVHDWWAARQQGANALMIAHRRRDVADLNARARERMRQSGRLGADEFWVDERAYAVGDRVVATRNDRSLGVINGQAGVITTIERGRIGVEFDDRRRVHLPDRYVRDGHLDHGYAITAHRAQGATVDRAFVLGSDELYREWGYTALSRHRHEARFYVSATPAFVNQTPEPLQAGDDVSRHVARMVETSRAEHLALNGVKPDLLTETLAEELDRAEKHLIEAETRLDALHDERARTRWYQRSRRTGAERMIDGWQRHRDHSLAEIERLRIELEQRPARHEPELLCGGDPLAALRLAPSPERRRLLDRVHERGPDREL